MKGILTKRCFMELTQEEFDKINKLENAIFNVENLSEILYQYQGEKEILIDVLFEKILLMKNEFNDFVNLLIKKD